ncbi:MAG TPA: DnaB-like helicase C-terminal domain-containing protein [Alphaproteobacteria bacterium]|nr:DnaB-like helicase C-terminal domain-containing protein [Alphaproteobacteria bacterium]
MNEVIAMNRPSGEGPFGVRVPPQSVEAEAGLIGAVLMDNRAYHEVADHIVPEHFVQPAHAVIWRAIQSLASQGRSTDGFALKTFLENDGHLDEVGGTQYLSELAGNAPTVSNAPHYAETLIDLAARREAMTIGQEVADRAYADNKTPVLDQLDDAERRISDIRTLSRTQESRETHGIVDSALGLIEQRYNDPGSLSGVTTGLQALDRILLGLQPADLIVLAGATSMGKSLLGQKLVLAAAQAHQRGEPTGCPAAFFSLEMSGEQITQRMLSDLADVPMNFIRSGRYHTAEQFDAVCSAGSRLKAMPLVIDDARGRTVASLRRRIRQLIRTDGIGLVVIDQLSHIADGQDAAHRVQAMGNVTKGLKEMAGEFRIPIVILHQINRAVNARDVKRPTLADLRDSGEVEQDADVAMFVYREHYYKSREEPKKRDNEADADFMQRYQAWEDACERIAHDAEIIVAKQRMGPVCGVHVYYDDAHQRFGDRAADYTPTTERRTL